VYKSFWAVLFIEYQSKQKPGRPTKNWNYIPRLEDHWYALGRCWTICNQQRRLASKCGPMWLPIQHWM